MKNARRVREGKLFRIADLLIYGAVLLFVAALFLTAALLNRGQAQGFRVEVHGETVYTHTFGSGGEVAEGWEDRITFSREGELLLIAIEASEDAWNLLAVDDAAGTAVMRDANCSRRKDCTAMRAIGSGGSVIVCIPHALRVISLAGEDLSHPSVG